MGVIDDDACFLEKAEESVLVYLLAFFLSE